MSSGERRHARRCADGDKWTDSLLDRIGIDPHEIDALLKNVRARISHRPDNAVLTDIFEDEDELILRFRSQQTQAQGYATFQHLAGRGNRINGSVLDDMLAYANRDYEEDREEFSVGAV